MPFTPFHLGPGAAFKAVGGRSFSFMVFGGAQVLMDIEPAVQLYRGAEVLHGLTHNLAGAFVIGVVATLTGRPATRFVLSRIAPNSHAPTWKAAATGAFIGTFSHVLLDALMHPDVRPLWPFATGNPLLGAVTTDALHLSCVLLGLAGGLVVAVKGMRA